MKTTDGTQPDQGTSFYFLDALYHFVRFKKKGFSQLSYYHLYLLLREKEFFEGAKNLCKLIYGEVLRYHSFILAK